MVPMIFKKYSELAKKIKALEAEKESLKEELMDEMDSYSVKQFDTEFGFFAINERKTYEYSDSIKQMEKRVKELKKAEEVQGIAFIKTAIRYPVFYEEKPKY